MHERKYEFSLFYIFSFTVTGIITGLMAFFASLLYPIFSIHKEFISRTLLFTSIDIIPNELTKVMAFPLYWALFLLIIFTPIDRLFKYREEYGKDFKRIIRTTINELLIKFYWSFYYSLLFSLCYVAGIWLTNNIFMTAFKEQSITMLPFMFSLGIAMGLVNITNSSLRKLLPKLQSKLD